MKAKETPIISSFFRHLRLCLCLCIAAILFLLPQMSVFAKENDYIVENHNLIEKYLVEIGKEISTYTASDTSDSREVSERTAEVINSYRKALIDLETHADVGKRSMAGEIDLAYVRCTGAGRLAWIYYKAAADIKSDAALVSIEEAFEKCRGSVDSATSSAVLSASCNELCADLNAAVYLERLTLLGAPGDSPKCLGHIEAAKEKLSEIRDPDADAPLLRALYASTVRELDLQRARDRLATELERIFGIVRSGEDFHTNKKIALFLLRLDNAQEIAEMNEAASTAVSDILPVANGIYTRKLIDGITVSVTNAVMKANAANVSVSLEDIFLDFTLKHQKSCAKDEIYEIFLGEKTTDELALMESSFNADGKIIDFCQDFPAVATEVRRAQCKMDLYLILKEAIDHLAVIMGKHDGANIAKEATEQHEIAQKELDMLSVTSNKFDEYCNRLKNDLSSELDSILWRAKAQRFLLDHKAIILKPESEIGKNDENLLRQALVSYLSLEPNVCDLLSSEINLIVKKYKISLADRITKKVDNDLLYKELSANISNEIKNLSNNDIGVFYNICDRVLKKADLLAELVAAYRSICSSDLYTSYSKDEARMLEDVCKEGAECLAKVDPADALEYGTRLENVMNITIIKFERTNLSASVRIASRDSKNTSVQKLVSETRSRINASNDKNEMQELASLAIFKIERLLTADEIISRCEALKYSVEKMSFISSEERALLLSKAESLKKSFADRSALCENLTVLCFVWDSFCIELSEISSQASASDLENATEYYSELIKNDIAALETELGTMAHVPSKRKTELISSAASIGASFGAGIKICETSGAATALYTAALEQLKAIKITASSENLAGYKLTLDDELDKAAPPEENYSSKNYSRILSLIKQAKESLGSCASISDCNELLESLKKNIAKVNDLLDDAKDEALEALDEALRACTGNPTLYSSESLALAKRLYDEAIAALDGFSGISETDRLKTAVSQSIELLRAIPKDAVFTAGGDRLFLSGAAYPLGYDHASLGYWGRIYSKGAIPSSASLCIYQLALEDFDELQDAVRRAAKSGSLKINGSASEKRLELMKKCVILTGLDITLSSVSADAALYSLQMLLPSSMADENILGLVFINTNGEVEYCPTQQRDMLISLELSHLSHYYIVCENSVNLTPLLIFLIILLVFEVIAFCFILFLRYNRKRKDNDMLSEKMLYGFSPIFVSGALKVTPSNGAGLAIALSVLALALGCAIAFLAKAELSAAKPARSSDIPGRKSNRNEDKNEAAEALSAPSADALPERQRVPVLCGAKDDGDADIQEVAQEIATNGYGEDAEEDRKACRRAEVNLDVIARKFKSGELVTPEALKKKHIISGRCDHVKILARGTLTKPLIVEAHDFSHAAEEMLKASGGEAIRI